MTNNPSPITPRVEGVELVECHSIIKNINELDLSFSSTEVGKNSVELVDSHDLTSYFSTLSTTLKEMSVEQKSDHKYLSKNNIDQFPQIPRFPREQKGQVFVVFDWLQVVVDEGHIEPSQPSVGRILEWPQRSFEINSLQVDFVLWCRKKGLGEMRIADSDLFYSILDKIFRRKGDRYEFPDLPTCRTKYSELRRNHEFVAASE